MQSAGLLAIETQNVAQHSCFTIVVSLAFDFANLPLANFCLCRCQDMNDRNSCWPRNGDSEKIYRKDDQTLEWKEQRRRRNFFPWLAFSIRMTSSDQNVPSFCGRPTRSLTTIANIQHVSPTLCFAAHFVAIARAPSYLLENNARTLA